MEITFDGLCQPKLWTNPKFRNITPGSFSFLHKTLIFAALTHPIN